MLLSGHTATITCLDQHGDTLVSGAKDRKVKGQHGVDAKITIEGFTWRVWAQTAYLSLSPVPFPPSQGSLLCVVTLISVCLSYHSQN